MSIKEFREFKELYLDNYKNAFKNADADKKRELRREIEKNINLTAPQKEEFWSLICRR